jgi:hypothetical protein
MDSPLAIQIQRMWLPKLQGVVSWGTSGLGCSSIHVPYRCPRRLEHAVYDVDSLSSPHSVPEPSECQQMASILYGQKGQNLIPMSALMRWRTTGLTET